MSKLILVATPIGNLNDMSPRAIEALRSADLIAAEDTRNSIKLLNHFDIRVPMTSYHEYNRVEKAHQLVDKMMTEELEVALITDAGMPGISDPGEELVRIAQEAGIETTIIPGPCAAVSALAISGLPTGRFVFEGFLPPEKEKKEREERLKALENETRTIIMYEAPHRLGKTVRLLAQRLGEDRKVSFVREITKVHEEVIPTTLGDAARKYEDEEPRGEYVLIIEGRDPKELDREERSKWEDMSIKAHVDMYVEEGMDKMDAMKKAASDRGVGKRDIYREYNAED